MAGARRPVRLHRPDAYSLDRRLRHHGWLAVNDTRPSTLRTPLGRVRYLGSAHGGTHHFWRQRVTAVALLPLTIAFIIIVTSLLGRNHAAVVQVIGSPPVAI